MVQVIRYVPGESNRTSCDWPGWIVNPWPVRFCGPLVFGSHCPSLPMHRICIVPLGSSTKWMLSPALIVRLVWTKLAGPMSTSLAAALEFELAPLGPPHAARPRANSNSRGSRTAPILLMMLCMLVISFLFAYLFAYLNRPLPRHAAHDSEQRRELSLA